jgi:hypothetical protein
MISAQTADKSVAFGDIAVANSWLLASHYRQTLLDFRRFVLETFRRPDS